MKWIRTYEGIVGKIIKIKEYDGFDMSKYTLNTGEEFTIPNNDTKFIIKQGDNLTDVLEDTDLIVAKHLHEDRIAWVKTWNQFRLTRANSKDVSDYLIITHEQYMPHAQDVNNES